MFEVERREKQCIQTELQTSIIVTSSAKKVDFSTPGTISLKVIA